MELGVILFVIAIGIASIWLISRLKILKHKFFIILVIGIILFAFFSFTSAFDGKEVSVKNISDIGNIVKVYFSWFGNVFDNFKVITTQAIKMDWQGNKTT